jgi:hypothetical protein
MVGPILRPDLTQGEAMLISRSCSFCHSMNPASERYCRSCGHETHVARLDCQCPRCATTRRRAAATADAPVPLGGAIAEALAALRRGDTPTPPEEDAMARTRKNPPAPGPAPADGTPRTAVSPKLAAAIRKMDGLLMDEFGPYAAFAYAVMGGDGLIAASNSTHGVVPPIVAEGGPGATGDGDAK